MASSKTIATEVVKDEPDLIVYKQQQEYTPRIAHFSKRVNSLISLSLDDQGKVKYHKDVSNFRSKLALFQSFTKAKRCPRKSATLSSFIRQHYPLSWQGVPIFILPFPNPTISAFTGY